MKIQVLVGETAAPRLYRVLILLVLIIISAYCFFAYNRAGDCHSEDYVTQLGDVRFTYGRLSLAGSYAGPARNTKPLSKSQRESLRGLDRCLEGQNSSHALVAKATLKLIDGKTSSAIGLLEEAAKKDPDNWAALSDLAAAYIEQFDLQGNDNLIRALNAADKAVKANQASSIAHFNFALALERNKLYHRSAQAWTDYLEIEEDPLWKREAHNHLLQTSKSSRTRSWEEKRQKAFAHGRFDLVVRDFPDLARQYAEEELLTLWADRWLAGRRADAQRHLQILGGLGKELASKSYNFLVSDSLASMDLGLADNQERLNLIALSVRAMARSQSSCLSGKASEGLGLIKEQLSVLREYSRPLFYKGLLVEVICIYQAGDLRRALLNINNLLYADGVSRYPSLIGKLYWIRGLCQILRGNPYAAMKSYEKAQGFYRSLRSKADIGILDYLIAECLHNMGDSDHLWILLYKGLAETVEAGDLFHEYTALDAIADASSRQGFYSESIYFRDEVVRIAEMTPDLPSLAHAYLKRAKDLHYAGNSTKALADLDRAEKFCRDINDRSVQKRWLAEVLLTKALVRVANDPQYAFSLLNEALTSYQGQRISLWMIDIHRERGRALLAIGDTLGARKEFLAGIDEFERQRSTVKDDLLKREFFLRAVDVFDELVKLASAEDASLALDIAERYRGIQLRETVSRAGVVEPLRLAKVQEVGRRIPSNVTVISYSVFDNDLLIWVLDNRSPVKMVKLTLDVKQLEFHVRALKDAIFYGSSESLSEEASWLFKVLIDPIRPSLAKSEILAIVPDKVLYEVPFSVLKNPESKKYLVEDFGILISPSINFSVSKSWLREEGRESERALIVGDPSFNRSQFPDLTRLKGAAREAKEIASVYGRNSNIMLDTDATKVRFLRNVGSYSVVHVASHILANAESPDQSRLILASDAKSEGLVAPSEISQCNLTEVRIVVIAGCRSAYGLVDRSEGPLSFVRAFLLGGAATVIGALWDIPDSSSVRLLTTFHRNFLYTRSSVESLRKAQLAMLYSRDPALESPEVWGGLQVYGSF